MSLTDIEITVTSVFTVKASDYDPSDFDHDQQTFIDEMSKYAREGMRNGDLDMADCWIETVTEVTNV